MGQKFVKLKDAYRLPLKEFESHGDFEKRFYFFGLDQIDEEFHSLAIGQCFCRLLKLQKPHKLGNLGQVVFFCNWPSKSQSMRKLQKNGLETARKGLQIFLTWKQVHKILLYHQHKYLPPSAVLVSSIPVCIIILILGHLFNDSKQGMAKTHISECSALQGECTSTFYLLPVQFLKQIF